MEIVIGTIIVLIVILLYEVLSHRNNKGGLA